VLLLWPYSHHGTHKKHILCASQCLATKSHTRHIYLFRHASEISDCKTGAAADVGLSDDSILEHTQAGDKPQEINAGICECGYLQAQQVAEWLEEKSIDILLTGPRQRCQQTAVAISKQLDLPIKVEWYFDEFNEYAEPFRLYNKEFKKSGVVKDYYKDGVNGATQGAKAVGYMGAAHKLRDKEYFSYELWTPEVNEASGEELQYKNRIQKGIDRVLLGTFPDKNVVIITHSGPAWRMAYDLTKSLWDSEIDFINKNTVGQGPVGYFHIEQDVKTGAPVNFEGPINPDFITNCRAAPISCDTTDYRPANINRF